METAVAIVLGGVLIVFGGRGIYRRQIGWSIGPLMTTRLVGIPGALFSLACLLGGALLALPVLVALISGQTTETLFIQIAMSVGLPVVVIGLMFAVFTQLALDLGHLIRRFRERSKT